MQQMKISSKKGRGVEQNNKKCGNCGHLKPKKGTVAEKTWQKELSSGVCEQTGKHMSGALIAGCYYWCDRNIEREVN